MSSGIVMSYTKETKIILKRYTIDIILIKYYITSGINRAIFYHHLYLSVFLRDIN